MVCFFVGLLGAVSSFGTFEEEHPFEASVAERLQEYEVEENALDAPFTPASSLEADVEYILYFIIEPTRYYRATARVNYTTPLTRAPPFA